jgi:hypothetical protein
MDLTEQQSNALLALGESAVGHDFIEPGVLNELLELDLVYWRKPDELDFTAAGEAVYDELIGSELRMAADRSATP